MSTPKSQIRLSQLTGSFGTGSGQINDAVNSEAAINDASIEVSSLDGVLSYMAAAIRRIHGSSTSFSSAAKGTFYSTLKSDSAGNIDLGSTTDADKFGNIFVADTKGLTLGNAEEHSLKDGSSGLTMASSEALILDMDGSSGKIHLDSESTTDGSASGGSIFLDAVGGIGIVGGDAKDIWLEAGRTHITANEDAAESIKLHADAGSSQTIQILNDAGTTDGSEGAGAIDIEATLGGISLHAADDKDIWVEAGQTVLTANHDTAAAIKLHADAGSSQTIQLLNDEGTSSSAIDLTATVGGFSVDGVQASNMTVASAGDADDLTISVTGATDSSLILSSAGTAADALQISTSAGGMDITVAGAAAGEDLDISANSSVNISSSENVADAIVINASAGGLDITAQGAAGEDIDITNSNGSVNITAGEAIANAVVVNASAGGVDISSAATFDIDVVAGNSMTIDAQGSDSGDGLQVTLGTDTSATMFKILNNSSSEKFSVNAAGTTAVTGDLTVSGDMTVSGTTTTVDTDNMVVKDKLIELANGASGSPSGDVGLVMERGSSDNAAVFWDESDDVFAVGTGSFTGATTGDLSHTLATFRSAKLELADSNAHIEVNSDVLTITDDAAIELAAGSGDIVLDPGGAVVVDGLTTKLEFGAADSGEYIVGDGSSGLNVTSGAKITLDATTALELNSTAGDIVLQDGGDDQIAFDLDSTSGEVAIQLKQDSDDLVFKQYDGNEVIRIGDDRRLYFYDQGGEYIVGDGSKLQIYAGTDLELRATDKVVLQSDVELNLDGDMGSNELVYDQTNTKLTIKAGGDLEFSLGDSSNKAIIPAANNTHDLGRTESLGSATSAADLDNNLTAGQSITMATSGRNAILYGNSVSVSAGSAISALAGSVISSTSLSSSSSTISLSGFSGSTISAGTVLEVTEGSDKMYFVVLEDCESGDYSMSVKYHSGISGGTSSLSLSGGADSVKAVTASSGVFAHSSPSISAGNAISFADSSGNEYVFEVMAAPGSNAIAVIVDANDGLSSGSAFSASSLSTDSGKLYQAYKTNMKFNQLAITQVDFNSNVFMSGSSDGMHFKAASGDRFQFDDAPLYLKDMTEPSTTTNRLYASGSGGLYWNGGLLQAKKAKEVKTLTAAVSAGSACNISGMSHDQGANPLKSDVFLNGQLMMSGSSASAGDYTMSHTAFTDLGSGMTIGSGQTLSTSSTSLTVSLSSSNYLKLKAGSIIKFVASGGTFEFRVSASGAPSSDSATTIGGTVVRTSGSASSIDPQSDPSATTVASVVDADDIVFHFALEADDVVQVMVMA